MNKDKQPGFVYEYKKWCEQYTELMEENPRTSKRIKNNGVKVEYLRDCGNKAITLHNEFGESFVKSVKLLRKSLHDIKEDELKNLINKIKNNV